MPITPEHVGRSYPESEPYRVSQAKIAEFSSAIGDTARNVAPPTFAIVVAAQAWDALFNDPELGLALKRTIHGEQRFTWERALRDGDEVRATLSIDQVRNRGNADFVTVTVALNTHDGPVGTAVSTLIHTREEAA